MLYTSRALDHLMRVRVNRTIKRPGLTVLTFGPHSSRPDNNEVINTANPLAPKVAERRCEQRLVVQSAQVSR